MQTRFCRYYLPSASLCPTLSVASWSQSSLTTVDQSQSCRGVAPAAASHCAASVSRPESNCSAMRAKKKNENRLSLSRRRRSRKMRIRWSHSVTRSLKWMWKLMRYVCTWHVSCSIIVVHVHNVHVLSWVDFMLEWMLGHLCACTSCMLCMIVVNEDAATVYVHVWRSLYY